MQHGREELLGSLWQPYHRSLTTALEGTTVCHDLVGGAGVVIHSSHLLSTVADHVRIRSLTQYVRANVACPTHLFAILSSNGQAAVAE